MTAGVESFREDFRRLEQSRAGKSGFDAERRRAFERFALGGIPFPQKEEWKYTNISEVGRIPFRSAPRQEVSLESIRPHLIDGLKRIVFVNGRYSEELSEKTGEVHSIAGLESESGILAEYFGRIATYDEHPFVALNTAFSDDGVCIVIAPDTRPEPIQVVYFTTKSEVPVAVYPRLLVVCGTNSESSITETHVSSARALTAAVSEIVLADGAKCEHTKIQLEDQLAYHIGFSAVELGRNSRYTSNVFQFGGLLVRNEIHPILNGEGIECYLNGLSIGRDSQHIDNHTVIDHAKPNCYSREVYKGVYDGKSSGVFNGTIVVRPNAQKTNAVQSNQSILLSPTATIDTRPQLKIWADDVKCTHGATVGQLDENAMFYLRSRGIEEAMARGMLIHAFASEVVLNLNLEQARNYLESLLMEHLCAVCSSSAICSSEEG